MAYKTIVTYLPAPGRVAPVLDVAVPLARKHEAHLIGLHVIPEPHIYAAVAAEMSAVVLDAQAKHYNDQAEQVQAAFTQRVQGEDLVTEWRSINCRGLPIAAAVNVHSAASDLVITSLANPDNDWETQADLPVRLIVESGRPVLLVPHEGGAGEIGTYVTVAWDGSREAARAAFDALPILAGAEQVKVLSLDQQGPDSEGAFTASDDMTLALARHGIDAEAASDTTAGRPVGEALLSYVTQQGGDLLVMGCSGHTRFREFIFGGATRHVLQNAKVPVLMAH